MLLSNLTTIISSLEGVTMKDVNGITQTTSEEPSDILGEGLIEEKKKKNLDEMIEDLNRDNPAKNQKRKYRGVF